MLFLCKVNAWSSFRLGIEYSAIILEYKSSSTKHEVLKHLMAFWSTYIHPLLLSLDDIWLIKAKSGWIFDGDFCSKLEMASKEVSTTVCNKNEAFIRIIIVETYYTGHNSKNGMPKCHGIVALKIGPHTPHTYRYHRPFLKWILTSPSWVYIFCGTELTTQWHQKHTNSIAYLYHWVEFMNSTRLRQNSEQGLCINTCAELIAIDNIFIVVWKNKKLPVFLHIGVKCTFQLQAAHVQYYGMVSGRPENRQYFCKYVNINTILLSIQRILSILLYWKCALTEYNIIRFRVKHCCEKFLFP